MLRLGYKLGKFGLPIRVDSQPVGFFRTVTWRLTVVVHLHYQYHKQMTHPEKRILLLRVTSLLQLQPIIGTSEVL